MTIDPYNAFLYRNDEDGDWTVAVKDVIDVVGMPTTAASKVLHRVPDRDAECVARLRAAGATIVGKLNTHEFAFGAITNSPHFGPCLNPWDTERMTGGSSGGSAAAVAAGLVDLAVGTDTAGSVRIPSAFCGVTGHKPSWGLVPTAGVFPTAWSLDTVGPLARTAEECRRALEVMAGGVDPRGEPRRVGLVTRLFELADPGVAPVCEEAVHTLWPDAEPVDLPLHDEIATITQLVMLPEAAAVHKQWLRTKLADYGPDVRARALAGLLLPSTAHVTGLRARNWARKLWARELGDFDLLVAPAAQGTAPRLDAIPPDYRLSVMPYNSPASLLGLPVTNVPCGFVGEMPIGLSLTGRRGDDDITLRAAEEFQRATDWHLRSPVDGAPGEVLYTTDTTD
jgi:aspartyl-tRNA(Asn)/glutamyl-tRNA(Gln) amidotransferase subunit A